MSECSEEVVFFWTIENFFLFSYTLESPIFQAANFNESKWLLTLSQSSSGFISSQLNMLQNKNFNDEMIINVKIELCSVKDEVFAFENIEGKRFGNERSYSSFRNLINIKDLKEKMVKPEKDILIIRCTLVKQKDDANKCPSTINCRAKTEICFDLFSFLWEVPYYRSPKWSETKSFEVYDITQFCVHLKAPKDDLVFEIKQVSKKTIFPRVYCEILLLSREGKEIFFCCHIFSFDMRCSESLSLPLLKKSLLEKKIRKKEEFYLKLKFAISNRIIFNEYIESPSKVLLTPGYSKKLSPTDYLTSDFRVMLFNKEHSDISFHIDGEILSAHKFVLVSRSPVFSAMLKQDMTENQSGVINITDMDVETLKQFLQFLYTGEVEDLVWKRALDLLLAAEKYQVSSLKEECSEFLKNAFSTDNICDVVSAAEITGPETLKAAAIDYIKENSAVILVSPKWLNWVKKNGELCSEILHSLSQELSKK